MKKVLKYIMILIAVTLIMVSCDDFLTIIPESNYSVEGAYKAPADFDYAIAAVYSYQQSLYAGSGGFFWMMNERSDDIRYDSHMQYHKLGLFTDGSDEGDVTSWYQTYWKIINRCNLILKKIEDVDFADADRKAAIRGEAYLFRGWSYFTLGWVFGGMPKIDDSDLSVKEILEIPRSSQEQTFDFAESDLKRAVDYLPATWNSSADGGRATNYVAMAALAKLYMFRSDFTSAGTYLSQIISSGIYDMADHYINCFNDAYDLDPKSDRLWYVQFTGGQLGEGQGLSGGILYGDGGGYVPYIQNQEAGKVGKLLEASYEAGDLRGEGASYTYGCSRSGLEDMKYAYPCKYAHYTYIPVNSGDWANDVPIIRYTDVLMMYAEVLNETSYSADGEAISILNRVRNRAGLAPLTADNVPDQDSFRAAIIQERRVEFAFEGWRWFDLIRWGIAQKTINANFATEDEGGGTYSMEGDFRLILAIPFDEISRYNNKDVMWQNPGY